MVTTKAVIDRTADQIKIDLIQREQIGQEIQKIVDWISQSADLAYMAKLQAKLDQCKDCFQQLEIVRKIEQKLSLAIELEKWSDFLFSNGHGFAGEIVTKLIREVLANGGECPQVQVKTIDGLMKTTRGQNDLLMETKVFFSRSLAV
jgi:hypothetical protein